MSVKPGDSPQPKVATPAIAVRPRRARRSLLIGVSSATGSNTTRPWPSTVAHPCAHALADAHRGGIRLLDAAHQAHAFVEVDQRDIDVAAGIGLAAHRGDRVHACRARSARPSRAHCCRSAGSARAGSTHAARSRRSAGSGSGRRRARPGGAPARPAVGYRWCSWSDRIPAEDVAGALEVEEGRLQCRQRMARPPTAASSPRRGAPSAPGAAG